MKIAVLGGDGIGPEVTAQSVKALRAVSANSGPQFEMAEALIGDAAYDNFGDPLPEATLEMAGKADAILFGAAGTYESDLRPAESRGGHGLLRLRKHLDLYANFRPCFAFPELIGASTLKREAIEGVDLVVLRELTGDIYFGTPRGVSRDANGQRVGINTMRYTEGEIRRVLHAGFKAARMRVEEILTLPAPPSDCAFTMSKQVTENPCTAPISCKVENFPARPLPNSKSGPTTTPLAPSPSSNTSLTKSAGALRAICVSKGSANNASTPNSASSRALTRSGVRRIESGRGRKNSCGCGSKLSTASGAPRAWACARACAISA